MTSKILCSIFLNCNWVLKTYMTVTHTYSLKFPNWILRAVFFLFKCAFCVATLHQATRHSYSLLVKSRVNTPLSTRSATKTTNDKLHQLSDTVYGFCAESLPSWDYIECMQLCATAPSGHIAGIGTTLTSTAIIAKQQGWCSAVIVGRLCPRGRKFASHWHRIPDRISAVSGLVSYDLWSEFWLTK